MEVTKHFVVDEEVPGLTDLSMISPPTQMVKSFSHRYRDVLGWIDVHRNAEAPGRVSRPMAQLF